MARTIVVTGKGGVGKTTVATLSVKLLVEAGQGPVLAVDADPNLNLNAALGVAVERTVGDVREEGLDRASSLPGGMAKADFLQLRVMESLVERPGFDLLAMGRPEGPGCYCFANSILRACVDKIGRQYHSVVIDCEAGLEHLSRRTAGDIDVLILLSDPSIRSLDTAARVCELTSALGTRIGQTIFALTRVEGGIPQSVLAAAAARGLPVPLAIPSDPEVSRLDAAGLPLTDVPPNSPALKAVAALLQHAGAL